MGIKARQSSGFILKALLCESTTALTNQEGVATTNAASCENNISQNHCNNAPIVMMSKGATVTVIPLDMYCQSI